MKQRIIQIKNRWSTNKILNPDYHKQLKAWALNRAMGSAQEQHHETMTDCLVNADSDIQFLIDLIDRGQTIKTVQGCTAFPQRYAGERITKFLDDNPGAKIKHMVTTEHEVILIYEKPV